MEQTITRRGYWSGSPLLILLAGLALSGCVQPENASATRKNEPVCAAGEPMMQTTLYFGLNRPAGPVITQAEWQSFVDQDVTPRFQAGLTVFAAHGQWLGNDGQVAREESRALMLIHGADNRDNSAIDTLRVRYKQRFSQESVMRVDAPVCVGF